MAVALKRDVHHVCVSVLMEFLANGDQVAMQRSEDQQKALADNSEKS